MKWVTECRPHVDRCASSWFVRRFVDPKPVFLFVDRNHPLPRGAIPYDLPRARFGHRRGKVTFDAFLREYRRKDQALNRLAALVRDIDTGSFQLPESRGLDTLLFGLLLLEEDDGKVLLRTAPLFDWLYRYYGEEGGS